MEKAGRKNVLDELREKEKEARLLVADIICRLDQVPSDDLPDVVAHLDLALEAARRSRKDTEQQLRK